MPSASVAQRWSVTSEASRLTAIAIDDFMTTKLSSRSVADTVERFESLASERGITVFTVIDHSGEAQRHGLHLRDTKVVLFGSPVAGTPVMEAVPLAAIDLPLKVLVWDDEGQTKLSYVRPSALAERFGLPDELSRPLGAIETLTDLVLE